MTVWATITTCTVERDLLNRIPESLNISALITTVARFFPSTSSGALVQTCHTVVRHINLSWDVVRRVKLLLLMAHKHTNKLLRPSSSSEQTRRRVMNEVESLTGPDLLTSTTTSWSYVCVFVQQNCLLISCVVWVHIIRVTTVSVNRWLSSGKRGAYNWAVVISCHISFFLFMEHQFIVVAFTTPTLNFTDIQWNKFYWHPLPVLLQTNDERISLSIIRVHDPLLLNK